MLILALALGLAAQDAPDYRDEANWLCRPGRQDACTQNIDATVIASDGTRRVEKFAAAKDPKFDCFYVYPTVSLDPTPNSDLVPGPEERRVAMIQVERFAAQCRIFAPVYRQVTLANLRARMAGGAPPVDRDMPYADVKAAWDDYMAHDNHGRGVVLIGHSQGSLVLTQLLGRAIEGTPAQKQLISAMLIGSSVYVPVGKDVGGLYRTVPLCRSPDQAGCIVTYASFRAEFPPPAQSAFARGDRPGVETGCTNPAALAGGKVVARAYLPAGGVLNGSSGPAPQWTADGAPVTTPFVAVPGLISTECVRKEGASYLAVSVNADPADPRTDTVAGDIMTPAGPLRSWGLHLIDMNEVQGDLVELAGRQYAAWARRP